MLSLVLIIQVQISIYFLKSTVEKIYLLNKLQYKNKFVTLHIRHSLNGLKII